MIPYDAPGATEPTNWIANATVRILILSTSTVTAATEYASGPRRRDARNSIPHQELMDWAAAYDPDDGWKNDKGIPEPDRERDPAFAR